MVGFVIPFKSKANSKNWKLDCSLLARTLRSLLNQTDQDFKAYVVCSDIPDMPMEHKKISWIVFPFPFFERHRIIDEQKHAGWNHLTFFFDHGKKTLYGASFAKRDGCDYIMSLDADDLLSNKLVDFVNSKKQANVCGWYINKGYMHSENSKLLIKIPGKINYRCGSVNIIRSDLVPVPDFSINTYENFSFFSAHAYVQTRIQILSGELIQPIPFYSLIYIIHSTNHSEKNIKKTTLRNIAKTFIHGKIVTQNIKSEFSLHKIVD